MTRTKKGYLCIAVTSLIFGTFEVVSKQIVSIGPETTNFLRFMIGGLFLFPFSIKGWMRMKQALRPADYLKILGLGTMFVAVSMGFYQVSLSHVPASTVVFLYTFNSVFIAVFAHFILRERIKIYVAVFILVSMTGLAFIVNPRVGTISIYTFFPLIASCLFGLYTVLIQPYMRTYGRIPVLAMVIAFGNAVNFLLLSIRNVPVFVMPAQSEILPLIYLGVFGSGLTYVTYYLAMELISVNIASVAFFIKPILATILAVLILNEVLTISFGIGALCILGGSFILIYFREREQRLRAVRLGG